MQALSTLHKELCRVSASILLFEFQNWISRGGYSESVHTWGIPHTAGVAHPSSRSVHITTPDHAKVKSSFPSLRGWAIASFDTFAGVKHGKNPTYLLSLMVSPRTAQAEQHIVLENLARLNSASKVVTRQSAVEQRPIEAENVSSFRTSRTN